MSPKWVTLVLAAGAAGCSLLVDLADLNGTSDTSPSGDAHDELVGDAGVDGYFFDDFDRPDDASIGNGWLEKDPREWKLADGSVLRAPHGPNYDDNVVYRPASEDLADVKASIEFVLLGTTSSNFPQVHARVQSSTVGIPNNLDAYILAIDGTTTGARIDQAHGAAPNVLTNFAVSPPLVVGERYRLTLSVAHVPPTLLGSVEHWDPNAASWQTIGTGAILDSTDASIDTPGSVGFAGGYQDGDGGYAYDNFTRQPL